MAEKKQGWFDQLYHIGEDAKAALARPLVQRKVARQFEAALDTLENLKISEEESVAKARENIANGRGDDGTFSKLASSVLRLQDIETQIELLKKERSLAFGE